MDKYFLRKKKGKCKVHAGGRRGRAIPHQSDVGRSMRRIKLKGARNILREYLFYQLKEALKMDLISGKVYVLIDFAQHPYYG